MKMVIFRSYVKLPEGMVCGGTNSCVSLVYHLRQGHASLQNPAEKTANELTDIKLGIVWSELRRGLTFCIKVSSTLMAAETSLRSPTGALLAGAATGSIFWHKQKAAEEKTRPGKRLQFANLKMAQSKVRWFSHENSMVMFQFAFCMFTRGISVLISVMFVMFSSSMFSECVTLRTPHPFFSSQKFPESNLGRTTYSQPDWLIMKPIQDVERTQLESENYWTSRGK